MKNFLIFFSLALLVLCAGKFALADDGGQTEPGIIEKPGEIIPLDVKFRDEYGKTVQLKDLINNKPFVLSLVYYRCPGICSPSLTGIANSVDLIDLEPGKDFDIITISFDPSEDYIMAAEKKKNYLEDMKRKIPQNSWRFLTGDSTEIAKLCAAVGWGYQRQSNDYIHGAGIIVISPEGKIARYMYGVDYLPTDLKLSLIEASEGRVGTAISKLMQMCFSYDPAGRKYVLDVTRISGGLILVMIAAFAVVITVKKKKKKVINNNK